MKITLTRQLIIEGLEIKNRLTLSPQFDLTEEEADLLRAYHLGMNFEEFVARRDLLRKQGEIIKRELHQ